MNGTRNGNGEPARERRAAIYCRLSKVEMTNEQFCSLDMQEARCRDFARAKGWGVAEVFADASTGSNTDRPKLQELLARAVAGDFHVLLVYKVDRLNRNIAEFWDVVRSLQGNGCDLVSVTESFDSGTPAGKAMMGMLSVFAAFERDQIIARTKQGLAGRAEAGWWPICHTPFGYDRKRTAEGCPATLVPNDKAEWAAQVFRRCLDGDGPKMIAEWLNAEGVRDEHGKAWSPWTMRAMLRQPAYAGMVRWADKLYEGKHPGIISPDLWQRVQDRLDSGRRGQYLKSRTLGSSQHEPALLGRVVGTDGTPFGRTWAAGRDGKAHFYYTAPDDRRWRVSARSFDSELAGALAGIMSSPETFAGTLVKARAAHDRKAQELGEEAGRLDASLHDLALQEGRLVDAIAIGVDAERVRGKLDAIKAEREGLKARQRECETKRHTLAAEARDIDAFAELQAFFGALRDRSDFVALDAVLRTMVHRVMVDRAAGGLDVALKVAGIAAFSNPQVAENGCQNDATPVAEVAQPQDVGGETGPGSTRKGGGGCRIRTREGLSPLTVFKTVALDHSANPPCERPAPHCATPPQANSKSLSQARPKDH